MVEDEDLREVMEEEKRRGRRPLDPAERKRREELLKYLRDLIYDSDEVRFVAAIRAHGLREGTPQFEVAADLARGAEEVPLAILPNSPTHASCFSAGRCAIQPANNRQVSGLSLPAWESALVGFSS
jgi:hypothetical protein